MQANLQVLAFKSRFVFVLFNMGALADYEALKPRLDVLLDAYQKDFVLATSLEKRITSIMEQHATHVSIFCASESDHITGVEVHVYANVG